MRKFFFQAVTPEGKQISGFVNEASIEDARKKLKSGGLSILTLEEPQNDIPVQNSGLKVFEFEAINAQKNKFRGTIEGADLYSTYKKLTVSYELEVKYVIDTALPPSQKEAQKAAGIDKEMKDRLKIEIKMEDKKKKKKKHAPPKHEVAKAVESNEKERKFIMEKIDSILSEVVPLLEENSEYIDTHKKREIEERINLLLRLKHSNSTEHLKSLTKRLLTQISSDEIFLQGSNIPEELKEEIERRKRRFQSIGSRFDKAISKGLIDIQVQFAKIDTTRIQDTVKEIRIIEQFINIFYLCFSFLFVFNFSFLGWAYFQKNTEISSDKFNYFFHSPLLWYIWGFSLIMLLSFYFFRFQAIPKTWTYKLQVVGSTLAALFIYTIQFPFIFTWTNSYI